MTGIKIRGCKLILYRNYEKRCDEGNKGSYPYKVKGE